MGTGEDWIVERAKEELQLLETKHPNHFHSLKSELKSFIFDSPLVSATAATQASTNVRHKRKSGEASEQSTKKKKKKKAKDRVEMVIERAEACLKRIQLVKKSLFS